MFVWVSSTKEQINQLRSLKKFKVDRWWFEGVSGAGEHSRYRSVRSRYGSPDTVDLHRVVESRRRWFRSC